MTLRILLSVVWINFLLFSPQVMAQVESLQEDGVESDLERPLEEVTVRGVKASLTQAVDLKRESMNIVDAIVAEDIGRFPDNSVAEALQRIPGVQVTDRGGGEVSTVTIRGLSDVTTLVNGRNIFTASGRQVELADIPATLVKRVEVYKTRSPEHIAQGLAGQIDIRTYRPFDFDGFELRAQGRAVYQDPPGETDPNLSLLASNRWDSGGGEFGALINVSYAKSHWLDQAVSAGGSVPFRTPDDPVAPLERLFAPLWTQGLTDGLPTAPGSTLDLSPNIEFVHARDAVIQNHSRIERERPAWNLSLQWAPDDRSEYVFDAIYSGYRDTRHQSLFSTYVDWWGAVDPADPVEFFPGTNVIRSRFVNFPYTSVNGSLFEGDTDSYLYALGGKWDFGGDLTLKSEVYYQDSTRREQLFAQTLDRISPRLFVDFNTGSGVTYLEFIDDPNTPWDEGDPTDAAQWNLGVQFDNGWRKEGDALTWTLDADQDVDWGWIRTISLGMRYDDRSAAEYSRLEGGVPCLAIPTCAGLTAADFPGLMGATTNHFDGRAPVLTSWAVPTQAGLLRYQETLRAAWGLLPADEKRLSREYGIDESQVAAYAQADFSAPVGNGFVDGRFGLRWLSAETDITTPATTPGESVSGTNRNHVLLPSLMVRWGVTGELMARFSYTETYRLPPFRDLEPTVTFEPDWEGRGFGLASSGNPDLEPEESRNLDISLEWYFTEGSVLYGTWFRRDIRHSIVPFRRLVTLDDPYDEPDVGSYPYILSLPENAGEATLDGWEFGLTWFPDFSGWLGGFGIQASYTILDSEQELPVFNAQNDDVVYETAPLGGVSDSSYSLILAYDRGAINARLSYFWREAFFDQNEARYFASPLQIWRTPEESLDFQLTWTLDERWSMTFDGVNLTEPVYQRNYGNQPLLFNRSSYLLSRTFAIGLRFNY